MPRVDFQLWDRVYILKLICTAQMTYSSFIVLVYIYLIILQSWTTPEDKRTDVMKYKWSVIVIGILDFGLGILLAFAANMTGSRSRIQITIWIISETFLIPVGIFLLRQLQNKLSVVTTSEYHTDTHYSRVNTAQVCFLVIQYVFIAYTLDFLVQGQRKTKTYDPSIRPTSVYAPTYPKITTTESRHIRMSQSLLFQPSSSKALARNLDREGCSNSSECFQKELSLWKKDEEKTDKSVQDKLTGNDILVNDDKAETLPNECKKKIYARRDIWTDNKTDLKDEGWMKEEITEWLQSEDKEKERVRDQEKEWTDDEKEWRRDETYWMRDMTEEAHREKDSKEYEDKEKIDWSDLEGKQEKKDKGNHTT